MRCKFFPGKTLIKNHMSFVFYTNRLRIGNRVPSLSPVVRPLPAEVPAACLEVDGRCGTKAGRICPGFLQPEFANIEPYCSKTE